MEYLCMENYSEILDINKTVHTKMTEIILPMYTHIGLSSGVTRNYKLFK